MIIPAILAPDKETFAKHLRTAEPFSDIVQIDILDNTFVPYSSWADPDAIKKMGTSLQFELHLMVNDVEKYLTLWSPIQNVRRAIFHLEPFIGKEDDAHDLLGTIAFYGWETGLAINPETPAAALEPFLEKINVALFLGVNPGQSGQSLAPEIIEKIRTFKNAHPGMPAIAVDGGVNSATIPPLKKAGADIFCAASAIFNNPKPETAYKELLQLSK